ncbi:50S ribosomal protein L33 [Candidatus Parcubacteria bacterium]|jgi:ribosomal protein L33|nr:MAG: 50S ribosomal protein L33 [Candidatus Parcubacteria bacterium]GIW69023.1 MAG: hypothetical protein KatS3mg100_517 [Candidatus Parcubacteria bacterium]
MAQDHLVKLRSKETGETYYTRINRKRRAAKAGKGGTEKLRRRKYSPKLRKHIIFEETKK